MDGHDVDRLPLCIDHAFRLRSPARPVGVKIAGELPEAAHAVGARALDQRIDVGERARGLVRASRHQNCTNPQALDRFRNEQGWRGAAHAAAQIAQDRERVARDGMLDDRRIGSKAKARRELLRPVLLRQGRCDVEQFLLRQADQRPAQQRAQRQRIPGVGKRPDQRDEVLHLLPPKEILSGLRAERKPRLLKRPFVSPQLPADGRQQGNVARARAVAALLRPGGS